MPNLDFLAYLLPALVVVALISYSIRILREYERGVVFTLGRLQGVKGPGLIFVIPLVQTMERVDLRTRVLDVPPQDVISRDNVSVRVNAVVYFRVIDPEKAIIQVEQYNQATSELAQTTLRSVVGQHELDQMLAERDQLNADVQRILDEQTGTWGIKVSNVELKHIDLDEKMVRAIARQAEAERLRGVMDKHDCVNLFISEGAGVDAIVAEMQAVLTGRNARPLRERRHAERSPGGGKRLAQETAPPGLDFGNLLRTQE